MCKSHLRDRGWGCMLELSDAHQWEGGGRKVLPVPQWAEGTAVLLQLQRCVKTQLLLYWFLQQRNTSLTPRYCAFSSVQLSSEGWLDLIYCKWIIIVMSLKTLSPRRTNTTVLTLYIRTNLLVYQVILTDRLLSVLHLLLLHSLSASSTPSFNGNIPPLRRYYLIGGLFWW